MAPVEAARWAWGNPKEGQALALLNGPFRNSKTLPVDDVIEQINSQTEERPVWIWTSRGKRHEFESRSEAVRALKLMRRPTVGDWVDVPKRGRSGLITSDEGNDDDTYGLHYGNVHQEFEPYLSVDEVQLIEPVTDETRWQRLVRMDGMLLRFAPVEVVENVKVALTAVKQNAKAMEYVTSMAVAHEAVAKIPAAMDNATDVVKQQLSSHANWVDDASCKRPSDVSMSASTMVGSQVERFSDVSACSGSTMVGSRVERFSDVSTGSASTVVGCQVERFSDVSASCAGIKVGSRVERVPYVSASSATTVVGSRVEKVPYVSASSEGMSAPESAHATWKTSQANTSKANRVDDAFCRDPATVSTSNSLERAGWLATISQPNTYLVSLPASAKADREVVMIAVTTFGRNLKFAAEALRDDKELVLAAVTSDGFSLQHASARLRGDREVVTAAAHRDSEALRYATEPLRMDEALQAVAVATVRRKRGK